MAQIPKNLDVYNLAYNLSVKIYKATENIPHNYRKKEQIQSSSLSVAQNLAEFCAYSHPNEQLHKLEICAGESNETETSLDYFKDVGLISEETHKQLFDQNVVVGKKLFNLMKSIMEGICERKKTLKQLRYEMR